MSFFASLDPNLEASSILLDAEGFLGPEREGASPLGMCLPIRAHKAKYFTSSDRSPKLHMNWDTVWSRLSVEWSQSLNLLFQTCKFKTSN